MATGLYVPHLVEMVLVPALTAIGLHSEAAVALLLGTLSQESHFAYLRQQGGGPAVGLAQIERATADDIAYRYLKKPNKARLRQRIVAHLGYDPTILTPERLHERIDDDLRLTVILMRCRYLPYPLGLPAPDNLRGLARYWKFAYNAGGKGTVEEFEDNWTRRVAPYWPRPE